MANELTAPQSFAIVTLQSALLWTEGLSVELGCIAQLGALLRITMRHGRQR